MHPFNINGRVYQINRKSENIAPLDLFAWLDRHPSYPKVFWKDKDEQSARAAVGSLLSFSRIPHFSGDFPFDISFFGGTAFSKNAKDGAWQGFPPVSFWLPEIEVTQAEEAEAVFYAPEDGHFDSGGHREIKPLELLERKHLPDLDVWKDNVEAVLHALEQGEAEKVVLARKTSLQFSTPVPIWPLFRELANRARHATLFAFQLSPSVCFMGASPEKLFSRKGNEVAIDALAGTRKRGKTPEEDLQLELELLNSPKERREFGFVKTFIEKTVSPLAESSAWNGDDKILKTSHVQHIHNRLHAHLKQEMGDEALIRALHPTPALGGLPRDRALKFIGELEPFDRGWYGAPVGVIGNAESSLYVAIRSGLICKNALHLFSGTGIVKGSMAEEEWNEHEHKIRLFTEIIGEQSWTLADKMKNGLTGLSMR